MKVISQIFGFIVLVTLLLGILVFTPILAVQIGRLAVSSWNIYILLLPIPFIVLVALYYARLKLSAKAMIISSVVITILNIILGIVVIKMFNTPLVVEPSYVIEYVKQWMNGPASVLHALVWTHWGYYGLLLTGVFSIFGSSVYIMKIVGVAMIVVLDIFLIFLQKDLKQNSRAIFFALILISCYPLVFLFLNFPTGDLVYIGLWGPVLYLFNKISQKNISFNKFIIFLLIASFVLSVQNLFKDTIIIVLPIMTVILGIFLIKNKKVGRFILVPLVIFLSYTAVHAGAVAILEHYAMGVANDSKMGYFVATGTSRESAGLFNGDYYYKKYWGPLLVDYDNNKLTKQSYITVDKDMKKVAKENIIDKFWQLPLLFARKDYYMWTSDMPIIMQTSFDDPVYSGNKNTPMEPYRDIFANISSCFLIIITAFFAIDCYVMLKSKKYNFINLFCAISVIGFFTAFTVMEGQPRYRLTLTPLMIISACFGIEAVFVWIKGKSALTIADSVFAKICSIPKVFKKR